MISVGPIAVLLVEVGVERGLRLAIPAALGVAAADLTFGTIAAFSGKRLQEALHPYAVTMQWVAAGLLFVLAAIMFRRAVVEIRRYSLHTRGLLSPTAVPPAAPRGLPATPVALAATMCGLTIMNPLTIVAFTSLVVATGARASAVGWPVGIAAASLFVHLSLVGIGSAISRALPPLGPSWMRLCGSLAIVGLAANLVVGPH